MSRHYEELLKMYNQIRETIDFEPKVAIVLGSGLTKIVDEIDVKAHKGFGHIAGFPVCTNAAHRGRFVFGYIGDVPVVALEGRLHSYEGYTNQECVIPVRMAKMLGAEILILTNAAGGINLDFGPGTMMNITDHISSFVESPLKGENVEELGTRFPDMSNIYDKELSKKLHATADKLGIELADGTYVQASGPNYESPAEVKMFRTVGADAVAMSTAIEAMAAAHAGMKTVGISCIVNKATDHNHGTLNDDDVVKTASEMDTKLTKLLTEFINEL
ncbi:MAG: purine-nucleoside phosphorylase [Eubacterium sp.]|nr:purine-nucleoside phosphorylase [Eubacterium sp.]